MGFLSTLYIVFRGLKAFKNYFLRHEGVEIRQNFNGKTNDYFVIILQIIFQTEKYKEEALDSSPPAGFDGNNACGGSAPSSGQKTTTFVIREIGYSEKVSDNLIALLVNRDSFGRKQQNCTITCTHATFKINC